MFKPNEDLRNYVILIPYSSINNHLADEKVKQYDNFTFSLDCLISLFLNENYLALGKDNLIAWMTEAIKCKATWDVIHKWQKLHRGHMYIVQ